MAIELQDTGVDTWPTNSLQRHVCSIENRENLDLNTTDSWIAFDQLLPEIAVMSTPESIVSTAFELINMKNGYLTNVALGLLCTEKALTNLLINKDQLIKVISHFNKTASLNEVTSEGPDTYNLIWYAELLLRLRDFNDTNNQVVEALNKISPKKWKHIEEHAREEDLTGTLIQQHFIN